MRWLVAVVALALVAGCTASRETREGADALADALGTPDWASSVDVRAGLDGQFADQVVVEVAVAEAATPEDIVAFVVALPDRADASGLDSALRLGFTAPSGATLAIEWGSSVVADEVARGVTEWLGIAPFVGAQAAATLRSDGGAAYVVTLGDGPRSAVRSRVTETVAHSEPDTAWQFAASAGGLALDFATAVRPTPDQVLVWQSLLEALDALPAELPARALTLHFLDRTVADLTLTAPTTRRARRSPWRRTAAGSGPSSVPSSRRSHRSPSRGPTRRAGRRRTHRTGRRSSSRCSPTRTRSTTTTRPAGGVKRPSSTFTGCDCTCPGP